MKREYRVADELGKQRSIGKFREFAEDGASVQLVLPLLEVMQLVQDGCGQLLREAGVRLMQLVMEEEAERLVGPRHQQDEQRRGYRWGNEAGYCVVDGQKVPIERIRVRATRTVRQGEVFVPFHFDEECANRLTLDEFDPISREPNYKQCAVRLERLTA